MRSLGRLRFSGARRRNIDRQPRRRDDPGHVCPPARGDRTGSMWRSTGSLMERSKTLPHALELADCPVSNFFHLPGETIAIDWAGLGSEPVGADGGRFVGSAITWGRGFRRRGTRRKRAVRQLSHGHACGESDRGPRAVRSGYLSEPAFYLGTIVIIRRSFVRAAGGLRRRSWRSDWKCRCRSSAPQRRPHRPVPSYIDEMRELLA